MKLTVKVNLNVRVGKPSVNAPCYTYITPGSTLEVDENPYPGDRYDGNDTWYKDDAGNYYWSGGFEDVETIKIFDINKNWQITEYGIDKIWNKTTGKGIKIAILDSGIMESHQDINKNNIILTKNFLYNGDDDQLKIDVTDKIGHGTHCAGIIAAQGIGSRGVAPDVSLLIGKITEENMNIDSIILYNAIEWAYENNADIISVSVTVDTLDEIFQKKIQDLNSKYKGILVGSLTDLGDLGFDSSSFLTSLDACIGVGAVNKNLQMDEVTARSSYLDILGPGRDIYSTWNNGDYLTKTGCSMATPFVAGIIALILSYSNSIGNNISKYEIISILKNNTNNFANYESLPENKFPIIDPQNIFNKFN